MPDEIELARLVREAKQASEEANKIMLQANRVLNYIKQRHPDVFEEALQYCGIYVSED